MTDRQAARFALHDTLPPGWPVGEATFDPETEPWSMTARSLRPPGLRAVFVLVAVAWLVALARDLVPA